MSWRQWSHDKEGKAERQQHETFSLDKLESLTAAGPNTEVRNKIKRGGSWQQRSPLARVCCSDDRQGELMRYDGALYRLTLAFRDDGHNALSVLAGAGGSTAAFHQIYNKEQHGRVVFVLLKYCQFQNLLP